MTYIKVKGKWTYQYRAADRDGQTLDFMLSERRNLGAARRFFKKAIANNGIPNKIIIDKSGANLAGAQAIKNILKITGAATCKRQPLAIRSLCRARGISCPEIRPL